MATQSYSNQIIKSKAKMSTKSLNLALVFSTLLTVNSSFVAPATATVLSGHLEETHASATPPVEPVIKMNSQYATTASQTAELNPDSFPKAFKGDWSCQTKVVDSSAPSVAPGQIIDSEVVFYPTADGRIKARWNQAGWVETQSNAYSFGKNNDEAKSDRTTYYFGDNAQGSWAARSRDQFKQSSPDTISATSYVDQYIDGQYVGRYRTVSVLKKTSTDASIAQQ